MVGLIPLFAVETIAPETMERLPGFARRMRWFVANRPEFSAHVDGQPPAERAGYRLLSLVSRDRLAAVLRRLLDEEEFLSPYGVRSLSRYHLAHPYEMTIDGVSYSVGYEPGESQTSLFGGNSNWRGPVWLPVNFLIIESLQKFHYYLGDAVRVPCPTGSDRSLTLGEVAAELSQRLIRLFLRDDRGRRPLFGTAERCQRDPRWNASLLFHEYFDGDTGRGLGASHQTGWTALVAKLIHQSGV
jgi:hypothetical protein